MALSIKNPKAEQLARELARRQGRSISDTIIRALETELAREKSRARQPVSAQRLIEIGKRYASLPDLDTRNDDEILGYDDHWIPR